MKLAFVAGLGVFFSCAPLSAGEPGPGSAAPDFALQGSDGASHKLSDFKGKRAVVLAWFPKAFTSGWSRECKSLRESGSEIKKFDLAYFAASVDTPEDNKKFAESLGADYPILSDPEKTVATAYGVLTPDGKYARRWTFYIGKDGKILFIDKAVKVDSAGADIAQTSAELGIPKAAK